MASTIERPDRRRKANADEQLDAAWALRSVPRT